MSAAVAITGPTQQGAQLLNLKLKQPLAAVSQHKTMLTDVRTAYAQHTF
jgi:hypothetical protein